MRVVGLFAGIGGFEAGLEAAGHSTVLLCDIDPMARRVLRERFACRIVPDVRDVRLPKNVDLVAAGFPCQDLSQVGTGRGISGEKSGSVRHVFAILQQRRPPWILLENVPFMLRLNRGHAMTYIVSELEKLGYNWAYRTIDARAFGLPQRRRRVFIIGSLNDDPRAVLLATNRPTLKDTDRTINGAAYGFYWTEGNRGIGWAKDAIPPLKGGSAFGIVSAPAILLPSGNVILPDIRDGERLQGFRSGWTKPAVHESASLGDRWRLVGNAVNVRVSKWIGRQLQQNHKPYNSSQDISLMNHEPWPEAAWGSAGRRFRCDVSDWPVKRACPALASFLRYSATPLSYRATEGFRSRLQRSKLSVDPKFISLLRSHASTVKPKK